MKNDMDSKNMTITAQHDRSARPYHHGHALAGILGTDEGAKRLGEVALIGKNSPVAESGLLFFNTLFDENASCHLALGKAYPTTLRGGGEMSDAQLAERGANDSSVHTDFMIGTKDLNVTGVTKAGERIPLLQDGDWVI